MRSIRNILIPLCLSILPPLSTGAADNSFGFSGKEIFPIDYLVSHLRSADLDGDGLEDLLVVNNLRSRITLLFNQTGHENTTRSPIASDSREVNELPPDARFRIESIASEKRISSITVVDLNSDHLPDIAYYGEPKELVVQYNQGNQTWGAPELWPVADGLLNPNALITGDLNGDNRTDLFLVGENQIYWFAQLADHTLAQPVRIPYSGKVQAVQVLDIQGDGLDDLLLVNWDNTNPFRFRLQLQAGRIGPEIHFSLPPIRSYWADDLDGDGKTEVITIAQKSGRSQLSHFRQTNNPPESDPWQHEQFELYPLNPTTKAERGLILADVNGDRLPDLLVAEPDSGQITLQLQRTDGSFDTPKTFPTLSGVTEVRVADWDSDGTAEIFLLSLDERQIGVTHYASNGRIPFPKLLPISGRPLRMDIGVLQADKSPALAVITDQEGSRELQLLRADGETRTRRLSEKFKSNPKSISILDLNQDGRNDIIVLIPYEKIKVLLQTEDAGFDEQDIAPPGGSTDTPWASAADVDNDGKTELLIAQRNFLRAVTLEASQEQGRTNWTFAVKEQINGMASNSRIVAGAGLQRPNGKPLSLFLMDAERKVLTLCDRDSSGVWQITRNLPLPVSDFSSLDAATFGGAIGNGLVLLGTTSAARITFPGSAWEFAELDGYESPIKDAYLHDVISGDLNNDQRKDLVFLETGKSYLDIVAFEPPNRLLPANRWQVFQERTFRNRRMTSAEPREALIADFTNDKKNDLVVLVHDRIILYPQQ